MSRATCQRLRIALVIIACLLFQQVALAAYACTLTQPPSDQRAMSVGCTDTGALQRTSVPALCEKHCAPDRSVASDRMLPSVPALALPAMVFAPVAVRVASHMRLAADVPVDGSDSPPRLRYCSLLI